MKKYVLLAAIALILGLNSQTFGFATIVTNIKGGDAISFNSNVQDIDVYLNGNVVGKYNGNNFTYKLKRTGQPQTFMFKKDGYKDIVITINPSFDTMFWGNIIFGGTLGSSTDSWFTNNTQEYSPNQFYIDMKKV